MLRTSISAPPSRRAIFLLLLIFLSTTVDKASGFPRQEDTQVQQARTAYASPGEIPQQRLEETSGSTTQPNQESLRQQRSPEATRVLPALPAAIQEQPQEAKKAPVTDVPVPDSISAPPNLAPFQPSGWSDRIVVSTATGTHSDSNLLTPTDNLFIDWAVLNSGDATTARFFITLYVDGVERASWFADPPLNTNFYAFVEDYQLGRLSAGTHTLRLVADALNNIAESNEFDNEYTKFIVVSNPAPPNLTPFQPSGWSDRIVVSTATGTHSDSNLLTPTDNLFIDWAVLNNGSGATNVRFFTKLFVDGIERASWFSDPPLSPDFYAFVEDYQLGRLSAGTHTLRIVVDALSNIAESNEFDNEYTKFIVVSNPAPPNLTPFQPSGWSDRIVVSTATGTHSDSNLLTPTDNLFIDWAVLNNGSGATNVRFFTKLFVDGIERASWFSDPPIPGNAYVFVEDFALGRLSAGTHTLRLVADALSNIAESNEFDNEYTRTILVSPGASCNTLTILVSPSAAGSINRTSENCFSPPEPPHPDVALAPVGEMPTQVVSLDGLHRSLAMQETVRALIAKAEAQGQARVIVKLQTAFQLEGTLDSQSVQSQRDAIAQAQDGLLDRMTAFDVGGVKRFQTIPYLAMDVDAAGLRHLEQAEDVSSIMEDQATPPLLDQSVSLIGAPNAWLSGFSGAGQTVAILDTGVDRNHPFLAGKVVAEGCASTTSSAQNSTSLCPGGAQTSTSFASGLNCNVSLMRGCFHGTHVAGIAAGRSASFSGVAKDANIIALQVFSRFNNAADCDGQAPCVRTFISDQMWALERVLTLASSFPIAAVNMSLGGGRFLSNCNNDPLRVLIDSLRLRGIATIIASGNDGYSDALSSPACISSAVSVGSTDSGSQGTTRDAVSFFSNSASFLSLLAPGQWISSSIPGGSYDSSRGTSMAAPHVAGAWAVLKSRFPSASVDQILAALTTSGAPVIDFRNGIVKPRIQVDAALNALSGGGNVLRYSPGSAVTLTASANPGFAFVKWQQNGVDFSTSPSISVQMSASRTMTAVFREQSNAPTINNVILQSNKLTIISGSGFGSFPRVLINGGDSSTFISGASDGSITLKGKRKKLGLRTGNNTVRVIAANGVSSNTYTVTLF